MVTRPHNGVFLYNAFDPNAKSLNFCLSGNGRCWTSSQGRSKIVEGTIQMGASWSGLNLWIIALFS